MRLLPFALFALTCAPAFSLPPKLEQICAAYEKTSSTLTEMYMEYTVVSTSAADTTTSPQRFASSRASQAADLVTTESVRYAHADQLTRLQRTISDSKGLQESTDKIWGPLGNRQLVVLDNKQIVLVSRSKESTTPDPLSFLNYWVYTGLVPDWVKLTEDERIEYNFVLRDFSRAAVESNNDFTTVTFDHKENFLFSNSPPRLLLWQEKTKQGYLSARARLSYVDSLPSMIPAGINVEQFDSGGKLQIKMQISITQFITGTGGDFLQVDYPMGLTRVEGHDDGN